MIARPARSALLLVSAALASCSSTYAVRIHVKLAEDVVVPPGAMIGFVAIEGATDVPPGDMTAPGAPSIAARTQIPVNQGMRSYQGKINVCCAPEPTVTLHAFIDIDGDRVLDPDEPRGTDPTGPVVLRDSSGEHRATIVITTPPA